MKRLIKIILFAMTCISLNTLAQTPCKTVVVGSTALCKGGNTVLTAFTTPTDTTYKYKWSTGDTTSAITANKIDSTTSYWVTVSNKSACKDTAIAAVQIAKVTAGISAKDSVLCKGSSTTLTASGGTKYVWNTGNSADTNATLTAKPLADTKYVVTVFNCACPDTAQTSIKINPLPSVQASNDTTIVSGGSAPLSASGATVVKYLWTPSTGLSTDNIFNPTANPTATTTYTVTGTDANGCSSQDSVILTVKDKEGCKFYIPNAFSPNGNGFNDSLYARGCAKEVKDVNFTVYDRWGEKVFETTDLSKGWDGTFNGKTLNTAVFVYYIKANMLSGDVVEQKGNVSLIR